MDQHSNFLIPNETKMTLLVLNLQDTKQEMIVNLYYEV